MLDIAAPMERRITLRLLAYWEKQRLGRLMPTEQDIDPEDLRDLWDSCFLVRVVDLAKSDYNYTYLGQAIADAYCHGMLKDDPEGMVSPSAHRLARNYARVVGTCKPLLEEGEFVNLKQEMVKYRQCLLPLGTDGQIESIFGGMHFRIFPAKGA
jgi:hypothetical protein